MIDAISLRAWPLLRSEWVWPAVCRLRSLRCCAAKSPSADDG